MVGKQITVGQLIEEQIIMTISKEMIIYIGITSMISRPKRFCIYYYYSTLLGNVVISEKFLRTRKIMVMHSNERGECRPRTLVGH